MLVCLPVLPRPLFCLVPKLTNLPLSLEKDPSRRATPWRMLEHPWMKEMRTKRVNMSRYLSQVWGWNEQETEAAQKA